MRARYTSAWAPSPRVSSITAADCILRAISTCPRFNIPSDHYGRLTTAYPILPAVHSSRRYIGSGLQRSLHAWRKDNRERLLAKLDFLVGADLLPGAHSPLVF